MRRTYRNTHDGKRTDAARRRSRARKAQRGLKRAAQHGLTVRLDLLESR
jgi:GH25 family lysozyme M1 (1,4-beta-N-acetylmuramidase)